AAPARLLVEPGQVRRDLRPQVRLDGHGADAFELAEHRQHFVARGDRDARERAPQGRRDAPLVLRVSRREQAASRDPLGGALARLDRPVLWDCAEVRERAADIHPDPQGPTTPTHCGRLDFHRCSASAPANPTAAITASVPTQSPSRTYQGSTSLVTSVLASAVRTSRRVAAWTWPSGSTVAEMPELAARAMPMRVSMARITKCLKCC